MTRDFWGTNGWPLHSREPESRASDDDDLELNANSRLERPDTNEIFPESVRHGILHRNYKHSFDEDAIFNATQHHVSYTSKGTTLRRLEQYNSSRSYHLSKDDESILLKKEIHRLVEAITTEGPYLFTSNGDLNNNSAEVGYEELAKIADQIKVAMGIIRLDNASISLKFCNREIEDSVYQFNHASRRLRGRFGTGPGEGEVQDSAPRTVEPKERNSRLYHTIVDYITATVARMLMRTAVGDYWSQQVLACLAACTLKIKILAENPAQFAQQSIQDSFAAMDDLKSEKLEKKGAIIVMTVDSAESSADVDPLNTETDASQRYHAEKTFYNKRIWMLLRRVLYDLLLPETPHPKSDQFQVHSSVYRAGIDGPHTTVSMDRLGEISASANRIDIKTSFTSMDLVMENAVAVQRNLAQQTPFMPHDATQIVCKWAHDSPDLQKWDGIIRTRSVEEVISVLVPLSLGNPSSSAYLWGLISFASSATDEKDPVQQFEGPPEDFEAAVTISTAAWSTKDQILYARGLKDDEVVTLPYSPARRKIQPGSSVQSIIDENSTFDATRCAQYQKNKAAMQKWEVLQGAIKIRCRKYVNFALAIAAIILGGSIAVPFSVGERIPGVDPFDITLFCWAVCGFVLIVAKSKYVNDWPWHDFIHGHVVCRSLEEVCEASKIDEQTVLSYLLLNEWKSVLVTRGPYNGLFSRKSEDSYGFSIDRPAHISTILSSGFIFLKILNVSGEHLISLDVRRESALVMLMGSEELMSCTNLEDYALPEKGKEAEDTRRLLKFDGAKGMNQYVRRLRPASVRVDRILGVYVGDQLSFFG